jgi:hypothetical protein
MATWPSSLPQTPVYQGYSRAPGNAVVRSNPEHGPEQIRRRFTAAEDQITAKYQMSFSQYQDLVTFFKTTTAQGSLAFDWPEPISGNTVSVTFQEAPQLGQVVGPDDVDVTVKLKEQPA